MAPPDRTVAADYHFYAYDNEQATPWTLGAAQPNRNGLQFYSMVKDLEGLRAYGATRNVPNIALTNAGAGIVVGSKTRYTKVLSFGGGGANAPAVVITGGIHAREWVAPTMAYLLAEYLIKNYRRNNPPRPYQRTIRDLVNSRRIIIAPMLNPHGNSYTVYGQDAGARLWRKNRRALPTTQGGWDNTLQTNNVTNPPLLNLNQPAPVAPNLARYDVPIYRQPVRAPDPITIAPGAVVGVDLNRNCSTPGWGFHCPVAAGWIDPERLGTSGNPRREDYFGPNRSSELETQNIEAGLAAVAGAAGGLGTSIDYHSYGKYILYPSEADYGGAVTPAYTALGQILQCLIGPKANPWFYDYKLGTPLATVGYDAVGTLGDRIALTHNARAFVIELDPNDENVGFELPENQIQTVFEKNIRGALGLIAAAGIVSAVQNTRNWVGYSHRAITTNEQIYSGWNVFSRGNRLPA
jgi:hypothetical protein